MVTSSELKTYSFDFRFVKWLMVGSNLVEGGGPFCRLTVGLKLLSAMKIDSQVVPQCSLIISDAGLFQVGPESFS